MTCLKVCGLTQWADVRYAAYHGVAFVGFIVVPSSKRYVPPAMARELIEATRAHYPAVKTVVVTASSTADAVMAVVGETGCDVVQVHSEISAEEFNRIPFASKIKVFRVKAPIPLAEVQAYDAAWYLFDTYHPKAVGGTGRHFAWEHIPSAVLPTSFIAGGLTPDDIFPVVRGYHPFALDMNSGLELRPGRKSPAKVQKVTRLLRRVTSS